MNILLVLPLLLFHYKLYKIPILKLNYYQETLCTIIPISSYFVNMYPPREGMMIPVKVILSWAIDNVYSLNHKIFWLYTKSLITAIKKSLCQSLKKSSITTFINTFYSMTHDLGAKIHQKWPLWDQKMRILWHKTLFLLELLTLKMVSPDNSLNTYLKAKKGRNHLKHHNITWGKIIIILWWRISQRLQQLWIKLNWFLFLYLILTLSYQL